MGDLGRYLSGPRFYPNGPRQLRVTALCASIAIALGGCELSEKQRNTQAARWGFDSEYSRCIHIARGYFSSASIEVVEKCERQACLVVADKPDYAQPVECRAQAIEASGQDPQGLDAKHESAVGNADAPQGDPHD